MSDSNRLEISYQRKSTTASASNALQIVNFNSESLTANKSTATDDTIREDGNMLGTIVTDQTGGGGIQSEFGYDWSYDFWEAALRSAFAAKTTVTATTISMTAGAGAAAHTISDSGLGLGGFEAGDIIWVSGFATSDNNGAFFIESGDELSLTVRAMNSDNTIATEAASASVTMSCTRITNANANNYFDIQKRFADVSSTFHNYYNCQLNQLSFEIGAGAKVPFSVDFVGDTHSTSTTTIGSGSYTAAPTSRSLSVKQHYIGSLFGASGGSMGASGACMTKISVAINNSARRTLGLNCTDLGKGDFNCTVNTDMLFDGDEHYDNFTAHNKVSIATAIADSSGNGLGFYWPKIEYTGGSVNAGGKNQDIPQTYQGQASGETVGSDFYTMKICKLGQ